MASLRHPGQPTRRPGCRLSAAIAGLLAGLALSSAATAQAAVFSNHRTVDPGLIENNPKFGMTVIPPSTRYVLTIAATPGEANTIVIEPSGNALVVRDGAGVTPGAGCALADATTAVCPIPAAQGTSEVRWEVGRVTLGDGDDSIRIPPHPLGFGHGEVDGGEGNDTIAAALRAAGGPGDDRLEARMAEGGAGDDEIAATDGAGGDGDDVLGVNRENGAVKLRGEAGDDVITGGAFKDGFGGGDVLDGGDGNDRIAGGEGDDQLLPGAGADTIDGEAGNDHVSFAYATKPVRADLAAPAPVDPTGEGDAMTAVESVTGGAGDDVLLGTDDDSLLVGGDGSDRLEGRGGRDVIVAGPGPDTIDGGPGDDDLASGAAFVDVIDREYSQDASDVAADRVAGGAGRDTLRIGSGDRGDGGPGNDLLVAPRRPGAVRCGSGTRDRFDGEQLPRDCERMMWFGFESVSARMTLRRGILAIDLPGYFGGPVTVVLRVGGRIVARGRTAIAFEVTRTLRLRVAPRNRSVLRRARSVRVDVGANGGNDGRERDTALLAPPR